MKLQILVLATGKSNGGLSIRKQDVAKNSNMVVVLATKITLRAKKNVAKDVNPMVSYVVVLHLTPPHCLH